MQEVFRSRASDHFSSYSIVDCGNHEISKWADTCICVHFKRHSSHEIPVVRSNIMALATADCGSIRHFVASIITMKCISLCNAYLCNNELRHVNYAPSLYKFYVNVFKLWPLGR